LTIVALLLGAGCALAADTDASAMPLAQEDFRLNHVTPLRLTGSADAVAEGVFDLTVANISGTVLLSILDDLMRITKPGGMLILTGFTEGECARFQEIFPDSRNSTRDGWACLELARAVD
jgi:ribosomal protein L11 methyltransferase